MKAITLWQPWASLVAVGAKRYETRSWPAPKTLRVGDLLAIHAAGRSYDISEIDTDGKLLRACQTRRVWPLIALPHGEVVAICRFGGCHRTGLLAPDEEEQVVGDWSPGRYAWLLERVCRLAPTIPARGYQGLWDWEPPSELREQLSMQERAVPTQLRMDESDAPAGRRPEYEEGDGR
mgnify:CR=1 FL=1